MPPEVYRVKRYPNRRLYSDQGYVTLENVAQAVKDGYQLVATNHKTHADITQSLLLDVLVYEQTKQPTLSKEFLHNLIRNEAALAATTATGAPT